MSTELSADEKTIDEILARLFITTFKIEERMVAKTSGYSLSISELHALREIAFGQEKTITQAAKGLKISVSALTIAMNKLVSKGYVERQRDKLDKRIVKLKLTEKGRIALEKHNEFHKNMVMAAVGNLAPDEQKILRESLLRLDEHFISEWKRYEGE